MFSQDPATDPSPDPVESRPHPPTFLRRIFIIPSSPRFYQVVPFLAVSRTKPCMHFSNVPYVQHALPISSLI
jgi:hypothetical protein